MSINKEFLTQLTANLYRLTLFFPKKEPLRYKIRELADDILAALIRNNPKLVPESEKDFEVLNSFFEVAKIQNWVNPYDVSYIQQEYFKLKQELKNAESLKKSETLERSFSVSEESSQEALPRVTSERQKKILEVLKKNNQAQVQEFKQLFPEVTKRTLRRDFERLLECGLVERKGENSKTFYRART